MALKNPSLFLYGFQITANNRFISFRAVAAETPRVASLNLGYYSLSTLATAIANAMGAVDTARIYSVSVNRNIAGGMQNRVTIATNGTHLELLFSSGNPSNPASLLGFGSTDYTGSTSYTGSATAGTALVPNQLGYNFLPPQSIQKNFGALNVSASGLKESIVFQLQSFWQVMFKYIPEAVMETDWNALVQWMIQQREFEFTPDITVPNTFYVGTLEDPNQGLQLNFTEHLSEGLPFEYSTPLMKFRVRNA
jgi:hypothetical protein